MTKTNVAVYRVDRKGVDTVFDAVARVDPEQLVPVRDARGTYWVRGADAVWRRHTGGQWQADADGPTGPVDVPDVFVAETRGQRNEKAGKPPAADAIDEPVGINVVDGFSQQVQRIRDAFDDGRVTSVTAEGMAGDQFLFDVDGGIWARGLASDAWYRFDESAWVREEGGPDPNQLVRAAKARRGCHACGQPVKGDETCAACGAEPTPTFDEVPDEAKAGVLKFLTRAEALVPEPIVPVWAPPALPGEPTAEEASREAPPAFEPVAEEPAAPTRGGWIVVDDEGESTCGQCGTPVSADAKFCPNCGSAQETPTARFCPQCGAKASAEGAKFCESCGTRLPEA